MIRIMATDSDITGPINIGNPVEFTMKQLAESVIMLAQSRSNIEFHPLPQDDPKQRQPDIALAKRLLGWEPTVQLADGLEKTIEYFKSVIR